VALVPLHTTPLDEVSIAEILVDAMTVNGVPPSQNALLSALAIIGVENARGAAIQNHNYGNLMAGARWRETQDFWAVTDPLEGQPAFFRAYPSHEDGAEAWFDIVTRQHRLVLRALQSADGAALADALYGSGYVVASREGEQAEYALTLTNLIAHYESLGIGAGLIREAPDYSIALGVGALALGLTAILALKVYGNA